MKLIDLDSINWMPPGIEITDEHERAVLSSLATPVNASKYARVDTVKVVGT